MRKCKYCDNPVGKIYKKDGSFTAYRVCCDEHFRFRKDMSKDEKDKLREKRKCLVCGSEFSILKSCTGRDRGKFCSMYCYRKSRKTGREKYCLNCGKTIYVSPSEEKRGVGKYCSKKCSRTGKIIKCVVCGEEIWRTPSDIERNKMHCSWECYQKDHKIWNKGLVGVMPTPWNKGRNIRTNTGRTLFTKGDLRISGENNSHWNGGTTSETSKRVNDPEWKKIRNEVYKRDNWTCQRCGDHVHKGIQCHHVTPWKISKSNDLDNLVTLCTSCHGKSEWEYIQKITLEYAFNYLTTNCAT